MHPERLILAYNADNGYFNALTDWAHKFFSPATYACTLCRYTYSTRGMLFPWKAFLESLQCPTRFLHRSEFREFYPRLTIPLPVILIEVNGVTAVLLSAEEIQAAGDLDGLIAATRFNLNLPIEELDQIARA
jgi:hypothetical protein